MGPHGTTFFVPEQRVLKKRRKWKDILKLAKDLFKNEHNLISFLDIMDQKILLKSMFKGLSIDFVFFLGGGYNLMRVKGGGL